MNSQELPKGWECPKCGSIVNPNEKTCPNCKHTKIDEQSDNGNELLLG